MSADSDWPFSLPPTVKDEIEPPYPSVSPKTDFAPEFIDLTDKPANFKELDREILRELTCDLSSKSLLETAGFPQKRGVKKKTRPRGIREGKKSGMTTR